MSLASATTNYGMAHGDLTPSIALLVAFAGTKGLRKHGNEAWESKFFCHPLQAAVPALRSAAAPCGRPRLRGFVLSTFGKDRANYQGYPEHEGITEEMLIQHMQRRGAHAQGGPPRRRPQPTPHDRSPVPRSAL
jgi:hypothetical protein